MRHGALQCRNAPGIFQIGIDRNKVLIAGQRFAKGSQIDPVRSRLYRLLVSCAKALSLEVKHRSGSALKAIPADEVRLPCRLRRVAIANDIYPIGTMRSAVRVGGVRELRQLAGCSRAYRGVP